ncbi:hypothetical protein E3O32_15055, partial [Cryobacterium mannosilyticum]
MFERSRRMFERSRRMFERSRRRFERSRRMAEKRAQVTERVDYWRLAIEASAQSHVGCRWAGVGAGDRAL